jgi:hypothetical protein
MRDREIIIDPWEKALPSRIRTLLLTAPLHRMESTKVHRMAELQKQDLRMLALRIMDATIERMGLGYGAARETIISELTPLVQKADESLKREDAKAVVEIVIEGLLNEGERRQAFREPYASVESGGVTWRQYSFNLLEEFSPDDNVYLRVTVEGIHLYTGMLGFNIEDAQVANEIVLQYQISRGRLSDAVQTAREAEFRSIQYDAQIQGLLNAAKRDIHQVNWVRDALSAIGAARAHILQRLKIEKQILDAIEEKYESAEVEEIQQLTTLKQQVNRCMVRHMQLHKLLISVNPDYLDEQLQQGFTVSGFNPLPNIDKEIFQPALLFNVGQLKDSIGVILRSFAPPQPPHLVSLELLIEKLTAPIREDKPHVLNTDTPELDEIETDKGPFSRDDEDNVKLLLQEAPGPVRLSELLGFAAQENMPLSTQRLLVLDALRNFGAEDGEAGYIVQLVGEPFNAENFHGDDLSLEVKHE